MHPENARGAVWEPLPAPLLPQNTSAQFPACPEKNSRTAAAPHPVPLLPAGADFCPRGRSWCGPKGHPEAVLTSPGMDFRGCRLCPEQGLGCSSCPRFWGSIWVLGLDLGSWSCHSHPCSGSTSKSRGLYPSSQKGGKGEGGRANFGCYHRTSPASKLYKPPTKEAKPEGMWTWSRSDPAPSSSSSQHRAAQPSTQPSPWCCEPSRGGSRGLPKTTEVTEMGSVPSSPKATCHLPPSAQESRLSPLALQHHHPAPFPCPLPAAPSMGGHRFGVPGEAGGGRHMARGSPTS